MSINIKQLRAFREVMLTGSISEAARNLLRTQPAISSLIVKLEYELQCELFSRRGGRLHPVPEAHYLFEESSALLDRLNVIERNMKGLRDLEQGEIRVISMPGPSVFMLPEMISRFTKSRSGVLVTLTTLTTRTSPQVQQLLSTQQYDVGLADIGSLQVADSALVTQEPVHFECLCAMRADDPMTSLDVVTVDDLDGKPMAALHSDHEIYGRTEAVFHEADCKVNLRFQAQFYIPLFTFVEAGQAYATVDPLSAHSYHINRRGGAQLIFKPFKPAVAYDVSIMSPAHRPLSNLAKAFARMLRQEVRRIESLGQLEDTITDSLS